MTITPERIAELRELHTSMASAINENDFVRMALAKPILENEMVEALPALLDAAEFAARLEKERDEAQREADSQIYQRRAVETDLAASQAREANLREVLKKISSCVSYLHGDAVSVARSALTETGGSDD